MLVFTLLLYPWSQLHCVASAPHEASWVNQAQMHTAHESWRAQLPWRSENIPDLQIHIDKQATALEKLQETQYLNQHLSARIQELEALNKYLSDQLTEEKSSWQILLQSSREMSEAYNIALSQLGSCDQHLRVALVQNKYLSALFDVEKTKHQSLPPASSSGDTSDTYSLTLAQLTASDRKLETVLAKNADLQSKVFILSNRLNASGRSSFIVPAE